MSQAFQQDLFVIIRALFADLKTCTWHYGNAVNRKNKVRIALSQLNIGAVGLLDHECIIADTELSVNHKKLVRRLVRF